MRNSFSKSNRQNHTFYKCLWRHKKWKTSLQSTQQISYSVIIVQNSESVDDSIVKRYIWQKQGVANFVILGIIEVEPVEHELAEDEQEVAIIFISII